MDRNAAVMFAQMSPSGTCLLSLPVKVMMNDTKKNKNCAFGSEKRGCKLVLKLKQNLKMCFPQQKVITRLNLPLRTALSRGKGAVGSCNYICVFWLLLNLQRLLRKRRERNRSRYR